MKKRPTLLIIFLIGSVVIFSHILFLKIEQEKNKKRTISGLELTNNSASSSPEKFHISDKDLQYLEQESTRRNPSISNILGISTTSSQKNSDKENKRYASYFLSYTELGDHQITIKSKDGLQRFTMFKDSTSVLIEEKRLDDSNFKNAILAEPLFQYKNEQDSWNDYTLRIIAAPKIIDRNDSYVILQQRIILVDEQDPNDFKNAEFELKVGFDGTNYFSKFSFLLLKNRNENRLRWNVYPSDEFLLKEMIRSFSDTDTTQETHFDIRNMVIDWTDFGKIDVWPEIKDDYLSILFYPDGKSGVLNIDPTLSLATATSSIQIDVPDRYRAIIDTGSTSNYIKFYDRAEDDDNPDAVLNFLGSFITDTETSSSPFMLDKDVNRVTTILENTSARVRIRVEGRFYESGGSAYLNDGDEDITAIEEYTFTTEGMILRTATNFKDGIALDSNDYYEWSGVSYNKYLVTHNEELIYGDGVTEAVHSTTGIFSSDNGYIVLQGTGSYQDIYQGYPKGGWVDENNGSKSWDHVIDSSSEEDIISSWVQSVTISGTHYSTNYYLFKPQAELDTQAEREEIYHDLSNSDLLEFTTGSDWYDVPPSSGIKFTSTGDRYIRMGNAINPSSTDFTLEMWAYPELVNSTTQAVFQQMDGTGTGRTWLQISSDNTWGTWLGGSELSSGVTATANEWIHFALVHNNSANTVDLYLNGLHINQFTSVNIESATGDFLLGIHKALNNEDFAGRIDEVRLWDDIRTQSEINENIDKQVDPTSSNLVGYWRLNENIGSITKDETNNSNYGTLTNSPFWITGIVPDSYNEGEAVNTLNMSSNSTTFDIDGGYGLKFDGSSDYVSIPGSNLPTGDFTYEVWAYFDSVSAYPSFIMASDGSGGNEIEINITNTNLLAFYVNDSSTTGSTTVPLNQWVHIAVVRSGSTTTSYINGAVDTTLNEGNTLNFGSCALIVGADNDTSGCIDSLGNWMDGLVDEVRVWSDARTVSEIKSNMYQTLSGSEGNLVGYWKFDEGTGQSASDSSPNSNAGTLGSTGGSDSNDPAWSSGYWTTRHNPFFKIRDFRKIGSTVSASLESVSKAEGADYNAEIKPFTNAHFAQDLTWHSTMESNAAITSPDVGSSASSNTCTFTEGKYGNGILCDASSENVDVPMSGNFNASTGTIEFWYKKVGTISSYANFFESSQSIDQFSLERDNSSTSIAFYIGSTKVDWNSIPDVFDGSWHHIRVTYDTTNDIENLYIDGVAQTQQTVSLNDINTNYNLVIGDQNGSQPVMGIIDEFRIYDSVVGPDLIAKGGDVSDPDEYLADNSNDYDFNFADDDENNRGEYIWLGSDSKFEGVNVDLETNGSGTSPVIQWEYWSANGDAGSAFSFVNDSSLEGLWYFEESSGVRYDETLHDNNLTENSLSSIGRTNDHFQGEYSADFNSSNDDYLSITDGNQTGLDLSSTFTICLWYKPGSSGTTEGLVGKGFSSGSFSYRLIRRSGSPYQARITLSSDGTNISNFDSDSGLPQDVWSHIAVVANGTNVKLYINGNLVSSSPGSWSSTLYDTGEDFRIGTREIGAYADGPIDEVAVFSRALSANEIYKIYAARVNEYAWRDLDTTDTDSGASNFTADGNFYFPEPPTWQSYSVNGSTDLYYIRGHLDSGSYSTFPTENTLTTDVLLFNYLSDISSIGQTFAISASAETAENEGDISLTTTDSTIQIDVPNSYRAIMNLGFTQEYLDIYDRGQNNNNPDLTHKILSPYIEESSALYMLRYDDERKTTILEADNTRVKVRVEGCLKTGAGSCLTDGTNNILVSEEYTFTPLGIFGDQVTDFRTSGVALDTGPDEEGYNWFFMQLDFTDNAFDDTANIIYGDGTTEGTTNTDGQAVEDNYRYFVFPGHASYDYQSTVVGIPQNGWFDMDGGTDDWEYDINWSGTEDEFHAQEQGTTPTGKHYAKWFFKLHPQSELDSQVEREAIYNDLVNPDILTYSTGSEWYDAPASSGLAMDHLEDYVSIQDTAAFDFGTSTDFTFEGWVKLSNSGDQELFFTDINTNALAAVQRQDSPAGTEIFIYDGSYCSVRGRDVTDNKWHHIAIVFIRNNSCTVDNFRFYVDGDEDDSLYLVTANTTSDTNIDSDGLFIGDEDSSSRSFAGNVDEVRIWSDIRTASEIKDNMNREIDPNSSNLIAYYRLNENSGQIVHDETNNNLNGQLGNSINADSEDATWVTGHVPDAYNEAEDAYTSNLESDTVNLDIDGGYGLKFDGDDDYVTINDANSLDIGTGNASLTAWIRYSQTQPDTYSGSNYGAIAGKGFLASIAGHGLMIVDGMIRYQVRTADTPQQATSDSTYNDGRWHHIAGTLDRSSATGVKLYIDGVLQSSTGDGTALSGQNLDNDREFTIGTRQASDDTYLFDLLGNVDEIRLWDKALSQTEIKNDMYEQLSGSETNLIGYWKLDEGSNQTAADSTSNNNNGTINGATWISGYWPVRNKPFFKFRNWRDIDLPTSFTLEGSGLSQGSDYIVDLKPFSLGYHEKDLTWYSTLENDLDVQYPAVGSGGRNGGNDYTIGKYGNGARFDASSEDINFSPTSNINLAKGYTEFWYQPNYNHSDSTTHNITGCIPGTTWSSPEDYAWNFYKSSSNKLIFEYLDNNATQYSVQIQSFDYSWSAGDWIRVELYWDDSLSTSQLRILLNGVEPAHYYTNDGGLDYATDFTGIDNCFIGNWVSDSSLHASGILDEFKIYDTTNLQTQIAVGGDTNDTGEYLGDDTYDYSFPFTAVDTYKRGEYLWLGSESKFKGVNLDLATNGSGSSIDFDWQYWGSGGDTSTEFRYANDANLEGLWYLEEDGSTAASDETSNGNDLTVSSGDTIPISTSSMQGDHSRDFEVDDGDYLYITHANQTGLNVTGDLTVMAWVKKESHASLPYLITKGSGSAGGCGYKLRIDGTYHPHAYISYNGTSETQATGLSTIGIHVWTHVAMVVDADTDIRLYYNGKLDNTPISYTYGNIYDNSEEFRLGTRAGDTTYAYDGLLDEVAVFSRALSAEEILKAYYDRAAGYAWRDLYITETDSGASDFTASGNFYFTAPATWQQISNSGSTDLYYIRGHLDSGSYSTYPIENLIKPDIFVFQYKNTISSSGQTLQVGGGNSIPVITNVTVNSGSNVSLSENTTTSVSWTATITDNDGNSDISSANGKLYRSGVSGAEACTNNNNNCYEDADCSLSNCSGNSCTATCTIDMQFHADPTDSGTYASEYWRGWIEGIDNQSAAGEGFSSSGSPDVETLRALNVTSSINYDTVYAGQDTGSTNETTVITNTGNAVIDCEVDGDDMCTDYPTCSENSIAVGYQEYSINTFTYGDGTDLTSTGVPVDISLAKPTTNPSDSTTNLYWGIGIPSGQATGTYNGKNYVVATPDS